MTATLNNEHPLRCTAGITRGHPLSSVSFHYVFDDGTCIVVESPQTPEALEALGEEMRKSFAMIEAHPEQVCFIDDEVSTEDAARTIDSLREALRRLP